MRSFSMRCLVIATAVGVLFGIGACSKNKSSDSQPTTSDQAQEEKTEKAQGKTVVLYEYRFNPNTLTVSKGTKVTFKNKDQEVHNVKIAALDVDQNIEPGKSWSYKFKTTGEFAVENRMAEKQMKMTIVVEE